MTSPAAPDVHDELMCAWRAGVCDGITFAVNILADVLHMDCIPTDHHPTLEAIRDFLCESGLEMAAEGRTR